MGIKFFDRRETIQWADGQGEVTVRGLSLPEITMIVEEHKADAVLLFDKFTGRDADSITIEDAAGIAGHLLLKFPAFLCHVVAVASDSTDKFDQVQRLPPDVLIAAAEQTAAITFQMSGGFQNFLELILKIATNTNGAVDDLRNLRRSTNGSEVSGAK